MLSASFATAAKAPTAGYAHFTDLDAAKASMRLFAAEVMPRFTAKKQAAQA